MVEDAPVERSFDSGDKREYIFYSLPKTTNDWRIIAADEEPFKFKLLLESNHFRRVIIIAISCKYHFL